jgi:hypothetical protein
MLTKTLRKLRLSSLFGWSGDAVACGQFDIDIMGQQQWPFRSTMVKKQAKSPHALC